MRLTRCALMLPLLQQACGDGSGPGGPLSGAWNFTTNLTGSGSRACTTSNFTVQLQHSGTTLSGTYTGTLACTESGNLLFASPVAGMISNGQASGGNVSFYFDNQTVSFSGTVAAVDSMGGPASWWVNVGQPTGTLVFSGTWAATR